LTRGLVYVIGHHDTPSILKLGKNYKVFEHLFNLKRGFVAHVRVVLELDMAYLA